MRVAMIRCHGPVQPLQTKHANSTTMPHVRKQ